MDKSLLSEYKQKEKFTILISYKMKYRLQINKWNKDVYFKKLHVKIKK